MDRKQKKPDHRALEIVQLLQELEQLDIAILFGSRATGAYEDGKSDIDIMLVQEEPPTAEQKEANLGDRPNISGGKIRRQNANPGGLANSPEL